MHVFFFALGMRILDDAMVNDGRDNLADLFLVVGTLAMPLDTHCAAVALWRAVKWLRDDWPTPPPPSM